MEEEFQAWLSKMYYDNCKERDELGEPLFDDVDAYYQKHSKWLREQFNELTGEK